MFKPLWGSLYAAKLSHATVVGERGAMLRLGSLAGLVTPRLHWGGWDSGLWGTRQRSWQWPWHAVDPWLLPGILASSPSAHSKPPDKPLHLRR